MAVYVNEHQVLVHYVIKLKYQLLGSQWLRPTAKHSVLFMWHKHAHRCSLMPTAVEYFNSVCVLYYQTSFLRLISYLINSSGSLWMNFFLMMNTFFPPLLLSAAGWLWPFQSFQEGLSTSDLLWKSTLCCPWDCERAALSRARGGTMQACLHNSVSTIPALPLCASDVVYHFSMCVCSCLLGGLLGPGSFALRTGVQQYAVWWGQPHHTHRANH